MAAFAPFYLAVAVSSFGTLLYYCVANLSALRLPQEKRMFPKALAAAGLVGCLALALALAPEDVAIGLAVLLVGLAFHALRLRFIGRKSPP